MQLKSARVPRRKKLGRTLDQVIWMSLSEELHQAPNSLWTGLIIGRPRTDWETTGMHKVPWDRAECDT